MFLKTVSGPGGIRKARAVAGAVIALLLVGPFAGCTVKKPQVPSTDFTLSIPVADDKTTIEEVVEEREDYLFLNEDGLMTLDFSADFVERETVGNRLRVTPTANTFQTPIGDINLPGQTLPDIDISLGTLLGEELPEGAVPLIPAVDIDQQVGIPLDNVQSVVIKEGGFDIALTNGLPMPLSGLQLTLVDRGRDGIVVETLDLGEVAANGGTASGSFSLAGKDISGDLAIGLSGGTAEVTNVTVQENPRLVIEAALRPLVVTEATAVIPEQEFDDRQILDFPDDRIQVTRAVISQGGLTLRVRNDIPVLMEIELSLDELRKPDSKVNSFLVDKLSPGEVREIRFDLDGNEFAPDDPLRMRLSYRAKTVASGTPVTIRSGGTIMVEAITEGLVFSRVEGVLNGIELPIEPMTVEVDFPNGLDNIALSSTSLAVYLTSAVGFRSRIDLNIEGTNKAGESASLHVSEVFERGNPDNPVPLVISPDSEELTDFLNLLPSTVRVEPTVLLGDGTGTEVIEPDHWVQIDSVEFIAPARFQIKSDTQVRPAPIYRDLQDDEARERIESNLVSAWALTQIENHMPTGVRVSLAVTSWGTIVRNTIVGERPDLADDAALLSWLMESNAWGLIHEDDRNEIRERIEKSLGLDGNPLEFADDEAILAEIDAQGSQEGRALFLDLLLSSLDNDAEDGKERDVEILLGREIVEEEWEDIISDEVYESPELRIPTGGGWFEVEAAPVDSDGNVVESLFNEPQEIELTKDEVVIFLRKGGVYTGVLVELKATPGEVVLYGDYYVNVQAASKIFIELNEDVFD